MAVYLSKELTYRLWNETAKSTWLSFYKTLSYYWGHFDQIDQELLRKMINAVIIFIRKQEPFPETAEGLYNTLAYEIT